MPVGIEWISLNSEVEHRRVLSREGQVLFYELYMDTSLGASQNNSPEVIDASGKFVHAGMDEPFEDGSLFNQILLVRAVRNRTMRAGIGH